MEEKELHYCEGCKKEMWLTAEELEKKGPICPNDCKRNLMVYLGSTEEEIKKRRDEFIDNPKGDYIINPDIIDENNEGIRYRRKKEYLDPWEDS